MEEGAGGGGGVGSEGEGEGGAKPNGLVHEP